MLETFRQRLKAKSMAAGAQSLTPARIDAMTERLNAKFPDLKDEAEHDAKIDDFYDAEQFKEMAAFDDFQAAQIARRKAKEKKDKEDADTADKDKSDKKDKPGDYVDKDDDVKTMLKTLLEQNKTLSEKVAGIEKEKITGTIKQKLQEKLKDVPASIWSKRVMPEKEEDLDAFITDVQQDYQTEFLDKGLITTPGSGASGKTSNGKASKEEVSRIVDKYRI